MKFLRPSLNITKLLISTPSHLTGKYENDVFRVVGATENLGTRTAKREEREYRQYVELTVETPVYDHDTVVIPDYSHLGENFCIALGVLFGKVFHSHGLTQQHGLAYIPEMKNHDTVFNKSLCFNNFSPRVDYNLNLDLGNIKHIESVLLKHDGTIADAQSTFFYSGRFYIQALRMVENNPELAFLSLITAGEILASHFKYSADELLDEDSKNLLNKLKDYGEEGNALSKKVSKKMLGISEAFCKFILECLDEDFFTRTEAKNEFEKLNRDDIKQRLKAAYNLRSKYVHAGKSPSGWMSVCYLNNNEEVQHATPVISDPEMKKAIMRSPTFIGMERIIRFSLLRFLEKTNVINQIASQ